MWVVLLMVLFTVASYLPHALIGWSIEPLIRHAMAPVVFAIVFHSIHLTNGVLHMSSKHPQVVHAIVADHRHEILHRLGSDVRKHGGRPGGSGSI